MVTRGNGSSGSTIESVAKGNGAVPLAEASSISIPDADDIARLWIDTGLDDPLTTEHFHDVPIGRPKDFFRMVPDQAYRRRTEIVAVKSENVIGEQFFLIDPAMRGRMAEAQPCVLAITVDRYGAPRVWPLKFPRDGEKDNGAWSSLREIAKIGKIYWVKAVWQGRSFVERRADEGYAPDPDWNRLPSFEELIRLAFGEHGIIRNETHPVFRDLFGKPKLPDGDDDL